MVSFLKEFDFNVIHKLSWIFKNIINPHAIDGFFFLIFLNDS
jgi:hypothetical protein